MVSYVDSDGAAAEASLLEKAGYIVRKKNAYEEIYRRLEKRGIRPKKIYDLEVYDAFSYNGSIKDVIMNRACRDFDLEHFIIRYDSRDPIKIDRKAP